MIRTPEEPPASTQQHPDNAFYTLSVGMRGSCGRPARQCCRIKREIHMRSATIAQSAYCPSSQRVVLNRIKKSSMKDSHASKQGFEKHSARLATFALSKLIEVLRECKKPLCLTFIDLGNGKEGPGGFSANASRT
ncbi:hypothetical protein RB195_009897 [Necator americanus]|uniref:Uncharacterized protein n=1 Tax=Necator americanus TaxID=51031 RepID=A0ABR1CVF5_NECAM